MTSILRHFKLLPHDRRMLQPEAATFFFWARILIFVIALTESCAWSYVTYLVTVGSAFQTVAVILVATAVFLAIFAIDAAVVTLDRAWADHSVALLGHKAQSPWARGVREFFAFGVRVLLLAASMYTTAPYVSQLVLRRDLSHVLDVQAAQAIDARRQKLAQDSGDRINGLTAALAAKRSAYEQEVAGKGATGRYGEGKASRAIRQNAEQMEKELGVLLAQKEKTTAEFEALAKDWRAHRDELGAAFGLSLPQESIEQNQAAMESLRQAGRGLTTEWVVRVFILILFLLLLAVKLFEPNGVRAYLSGALQQEYKRWESGLFDGYLPPEERSSAPVSAMTPDRLFQFLTGTWLPGQKMLGEKERARLQAVAAGQPLVELERYRDVAAQEYDEARRVHTPAALAAKNARLDLASLRDAIRVVKEDFETVSAEIDEIEAAGDDQMNRRTRENRLGIAQEDLATVRQKLQELEFALPAKEDLARATQLAADETAQRLSARKADLEAEELKVRDLRRALARATSELGHSMLQPSAHQPFPAWAAAPAAKH